MMNRITAIIEILRKSTQGMRPPASAELIQEFGQDPFLILVSCILSLRTKDKVTVEASRRLFAHMKTPYDLVQLDTLFVQQLIYPTGFYKQKAFRLKAIAQRIIEVYKGVVPSEQEELLKLPGVGIKTAALVRAEGFNIPALCVDTHVHRISNRLGLVHTKTPEQTQQELMKILPQEYWIEYNRLMVMWGQNICVPASPKCSQCPLAALCPKIGVTTSR